MSGALDRPVRCSKCGAEAAIPSGYCAACGARLKIDQQDQTPTLETNPYASPRVITTSTSVSLNDPTMIRRVEALLKDAKQVWWALLIGFFCTALAWVAICPWCIYRLVNWFRLAKEYPLLLSPEVSDASIERRFQRARVRLIIGTVISTAMLVGLVAVIALAILRDL